MLRRYTFRERLLLGASEVLRHARWYLLALCMALAVTGALLAYGASPPTRSHEEVLLRVPRGSTDAQVAELLRRNGLIRSRTAFGVIRHIGYEGRPFVAGTYRMRKDLRLFDVIQMLVNGEVASVRVTVPEGFTLKQIAARLEKHGVTEADAFLDKASSGAVNFDIASPTGSLEGYLFPDTYQFSFQSTPDDAIRIMLANLERRVSKPHAGDISDSGLSLHEILTIASLVEREARTAEDRPLIASVIHNRLERGMRLEIDATVLYALGQHKSRVLYRDLEAESPYNTYRNAGLPPGPIANPGLESVKAALSPASTDYLYYVATPSGSHLFARTFAEHQANIRRARSL